MNKPSLGKSLLFAWLLFAAFSAQSEQSLTMAEAIRLATQSQPLLQSQKDSCLIQNRSSACKTCRSLAVSAAKHRLMKNWRKPAPV